jgi:hypothetical protein
MLASRLLESSSSTAASPTDAPCAGGRGALGEADGAVADRTTVFDDSVPGAARWVATPTASAHVSGDAADIGPPAAAAWLSLHGAAYALCQIYANEPWHYDLRPEAVGLRRTPRPRPACRAAPAGG